MAENTFLGLQPYTEDDAYRFKGRTEESQELFRLIVRNDFTVCYAESGEGKTSLLNAGVFPLLRENMYFPIAITFTSDDYKVTPDSFDAIIDRCIKDSIAEYNEKNRGINIEYKLCSTDFQGLDSQEELQRELSKYSWWKLRNYRPQAMGLTFTPVFVFDQFEEVFNLPGSIVWTKKFFDWLENVSSDSCPEEIVKKVREIIGDKAAFPSIKEEKGFKAVFSLRKEFIGELDYWGRQTHFVPALKDNRYCLKALTYEGARKVMTQQERFDADKVEQVLTHFVGQYSREPEKTITENLPAIPALLLSVVCDSWEKDIAAFTKLSTNEIGQSLNKILEKFYDEVIASIVREICQCDDRKNFEDKIIESTINEWMQMGDWEMLSHEVESLKSQLPQNFHVILCKDINASLFDLVDINGKRVRIKAATSFMTRRVGEEELRILKYKEILNNHRIIKITKIDGEDYVEIVHDCLCPIIAKRREIRLATEAKEREERLLREQTRKMRKRLSLFSLISIVVLGLMALFLYQNRRNQIVEQNLNQTQESLVLSESEKKTIQKQKDEMALLNDSISKLNLSLLDNMKIIKHQKDSINTSLIEQQKLNSNLSKQMVINQRQKDTLFYKNQLIQDQLLVLKAKTDSLQAQSDLIALQTGVIEKQYDVIERGTNASMSLDMKNAFDACVAIRSAVESGSEQNLQLANNIFKRYDTSPFSSLRAVDDEIMSLNGHFIFNTDFIDSLIAGKNVYSKAQMFANELVSRGKAANGSILIKNCIVRKESSTKYRFASRGYQEIAIVTEPGGLVTLRVYDKTNGRIYADTENVRKGMSTRFISFDLENNKRVTLEIEIENRTGKDISFIVLSN